MFPHYPLRIPDTSVVFQWFTIKVFELICVFIHSQRLKIKELPKEYLLSEMIIPVYYFSFLILKVAYHHEQLLVNVMESQLYFIYV